MPAPTQPASPMVRTELPLPPAESPLPVAHRTLEMHDLSTPNFPPREPSLFAPASSAVYPTTATSARFMQPAPHPLSGHYGLHPAYPAPPLALATPHAMSTPPERPTRSRGVRQKLQCALCTSTFSRKDNLKTHQRIHSGEMPFQCGFCGRRFRWQSSARTHEQGHQRRGHTRLPPGALPAQPARMAPRPAISKTPIRPRAQLPAELDLDRLLSAGALAGSLADDGEDEHQPAVSEALVLAANSFSPGSNLEASAEESPMFSVPNLSQQELERCLDKAEEQ